MPLEIGTKVTLRDAYLDEARTRPVTGTIEDVYPRPDWDGRTAYVVMLNHDDRGLPPGASSRATSFVPFRQRLGNARRA